MAAGKMGWVPPDILSLNAWIWKTWNMTWPSTRPLSHISCLHLWKEASDRVPPPAPFLPDMKLFQALDETYTVLVRHGLSREGPTASATPILSWRRDIIRAFEALVHDLQGFHPAFLPLQLAQTIQKGSVRLPKVIVLAAFEAPAPVENTLFDCLASQCTLRRFDLPAGAPEITERVVTPSRKQEVAWLTRELVTDARTTSLNRLGVVVPDTETYVPCIKHAFREIMGKPIDQSRSAYNISLGTPLLDQPLVQSGVLPLRFWAQGQPRTLLLALVLSTYYARWATNRDRIARADSVWRKQGMDTDLRSLLQTLLDHSPEIFSQVNGSHPTLEQALGSFLQGSDRTVSEWVRTLEEFWNAVGFPVITDEADSVAWRHVRTVLHRMREDLKRTSMNLADFKGLLQHLLSKERVQTQGSEEAGIQVLGVIESRGLSFERLYVIGLSAASFPSPVRPLPLLDAWERHQVQGATAESQYAFGEEAFRHLLACAPHVTLIRPEEESAEPLAASPFWAQVAAEEVHRTVDPWNAPDPVWARATWLQDAKKGLANPAVFPPDDPPVAGDILPKAVSVSQLAAAFVCPFRFYAETVLKVFPLEELIMGMSPSERGNRLHRALAFFTRRYRDQAPTEKKDAAFMETLIRACSDEALSLDHGQAHHAGKDALGRHSRVMERRRWIGGNDEAPGLLTQWLDVELQRLDEGWCWLSEESSFEGLTAPGWPFSLSGRIDRIDGHRDKGLMLWDYKSGEHPSKQAVVEHLIDPQIPAYVFAAKEHRIAGLEKAPGPGAHVSGGYILLKGPSSVGHKALTPKDGIWDPVLKLWKEAVEALGNKLASGEFKANPYPVSDGARQKAACQYCPYKPLCGRQESAFYM